MGDLHCMTQEINLDYVSPYEPDPKILYTFSSLKYFNDLMNGDLWFAPTSTYNDVHENTLFVRPIGNASSDDCFKAERQIRNELDSLVVRCFTRDPTNTLMWAHYAQSHAGVCIGLRFDELIKCSGNHYPIRYSNLPPLSLVSEHPLDAQQLHYLVFDTMMTKSIHWAYEQEHRFYVKNKAMAEKDGGLISIGSDAIVDVIFGAKVDAETIEKCRPAIPKDVRVYCAEIVNRELRYNLPLRELE